MTIIDNDDETADKPHVAAPATGLSKSRPVADDQRRKSRGWRWLLGSAVICPCHLPVTLALLGTALGGTAIGATLHRHVVLAGLIIAAVWLFVTWRGLRLLSQKSVCPLPSSRQGSSSTRTE